MLLTQAGCHTLGLYCKHADMQVHCQKPVLLMTSLAVAQYTCTLGVLLWTVGPGCGGVKLLYTHVSETDSNTTDTIKLFQRGGGGRWGGCGGGGVGGGGGGG